MFLFALTMDNCNTRVFLL